MKATILQANPQRGMFIFECEDNQTGYFEILGGYDLEAGDIVSGEFMGLGGETLVNVQTGERMDVFIQDYCSYEMACKMVFR